MKQIICVDASSLKGSACGRKLFLTTALGYTSPKLSNDLLYGTCFHRAAELSAHGHSDQECMEAALKKWDEDIGDCEIKPTAKYLTKEHLGSVLFRFFLEQKTNEIFYKCPYIKVGSTVLAECKFAIPIYSDNEVDVLLQGTMDGIFQLMQGCAAIGDWKTTRARFPSEYFFGYKMSVQLRTYMWAVNWYIKHYPDSAFALAFKDALKVGAFIYGAFLSSQGATFLRSQLFTFSKRDMQEYEQMLMGVVKKLVSNAKSFNETGLYPPAEGIINGSCQEVYGSNCKYYNACASQVGLADSEDPMPLFEGLLSNHFIRKAYRPLEFGGGEKKETQTNNMIKNKLITALLALVSASVAAKAEDWKQWSFVVSPVYSVAVSDLKFSDVRYGGGLRGELFVLNNLSVEAQGVTYDIHNSVVDEASLSLNYYIPVAKTPFSLVASLGTLKGFEQNENWQYKGGAAVVAKVTDSVSARVGGYLVDDFRHSTELRFEAGIGYKF